ncbi:protein WEAK CHLOROPLAST MOVEMENT UNDER BLUE LIGHT 1-like protein isoform X1 [Cinnamomum micranthum f. kanehirae]|uniref:Protein WEAK CHLOROPLAST MOVEMENT UNDER BLUE LIGHT 1-like protein isoform X1 n=1 Tax=Cinnamomum micranthum f. kanehirae TaxID=337451 RepID=A0A3S3MAN9_9MAGN|nr:protein WEAK CHLOROPLAST MOVEMENT UNDER BLUE LIGHT 1-like protein isoform X1 [Cinnamomum micranthum f. kanehirae]
MRLDSSIVTNPSVSLRVLRRICFKAALQEEAAEAATPIRLLLTETHFVEFRPDIGQIGSFETCDLKQDSMHAKEPYRTAIYTKWDEENRELDFVQKELASYKVQLEIQESASMQALLKLEGCQKTIEELSAQVKKSEADRDKYIKEFEKAKNRKDILEIENKEITTPLLDFKKAPELLLSSVNDLKATQGLLKEQLAAAEESKQAALNQVRLMETAVDIEKRKAEELLKHVSELNEAILLLKLAATEAEKEKAAILLKKDEEIHLAASGAMQAHDQLEEMRKQLDEAKDLENELLKKSLLIDSLQSELAHVKESYISAINDLNRLKLEMECLEKYNSERAIYMESMETQLKQSQEELLNATEEINSLKHQIEAVTVDMQKSRENLAEIQEKEKEAQVEVALLKSEIHKEKAKVAAAEAAEARGKSSNLGLYLAVQQLAVEAEMAKKETKRIKQKALHAESIIDTENLIREQEMFMAEEPGLKSATACPDSSGFQSGIIISAEEYQSLLKKASKADQESSQSLASENAYELENLKKELEAKTAEIRGLKSVADEATRRANMAENAKMAIEDQLRKWREQKQRRRAALAALREESILREGNPPIIEKSPSYVPLGTVLNLKF